jgi:TolB-like protein
MDSEQAGGTPEPANALQPSPPSAADAAAAEKKRQKKKAKVRSAWISFAGRIIAQIVGAAATIVLGIYLVTSHTGRSDGAAAPRAVRAARSPATEPSLAVLPFDNFSGDASQDHFVNGMTEALIADLARVRGLRVISRTSSMLYRGEKKPLPQIANELGVDLLVEGSVARAGNRVRITAQLIDGASDEHIWARSYEDEVEDVLRPPLRPRRHRRAARTRARAAPHACPADRGPLARRAGPRHRGGEAAERAARDDA